MHKLRENFSNFFGLFLNFKRLFLIAIRDHPVIMVSLALVGVLSALITFGRSAGQAFFLNVVTDIGNRRGELPLALIFFGSMYFVPEVIYNLKYYLDKLYWIYMQQKFQLMLYWHRSQIDVALLDDKDFSSTLDKANGRTFAPASTLMNSLVSGEYIVRFIVASSILLSANAWMFLVIFIALLPKLYLELAHSKETWSIWDEDTDARKHIEDLQRQTRNPNWLTELKLFQNTKVVWQKIKGYMVEFRSKQHGLEKRKFLKWFFADLFIGIILSLSFVFMVRQTLQGTLPIGNLIFLLAAMTQLQDSLAQFFSILGRLYESNLYVTEFFKVIDVKPWVPRAKKPVIIDSTKPPKIEFKDVWFKYPAQKDYALKKFNLTLEPGQKLAIVGLSGAGKSTIVKLLCRFYDPTKGKILVNGIDLKKIDLESWWSTIGAIFQEYSQWNETFEENIALGRSSVDRTPEKVRDAADKAEAHEFIMEKGGYQTMVGNKYNGVELSVGQKQRMALSRLFYRNAELLILDEPTSSVDALSEQKIFEALDESKGKSVIMITHRFSTVKNANMIAVVRHGEIIESGNHQDLMDRNDVYADLYRRQAKAYVEDVPVAA